VPRPATFALKSRCPLPASAGSGLGIWVWAAREMADYHSSAHPAHYQAAPDHAGVDSLHV